MILLIGYAYVIAFYGHLGQCYMMGEAQLINTDPKWPSNIDNGLVYPIMVCSNPGVRVKPVIIG